MQTEDDNIDFEHLLNGSIKNVSVLLADIFSDNSISEKFLEFLEKNILRGKSKKVIEFIEQGGFHNTFPQLLRILADAYDSKGDKIKSAEIYVSLSEIFPNDNEYYYLAAKNFFEANEYNRALFILNKTLNSNAELPKVYFLAGSLFKELKDYEKSIYYYKKALEFGNADYDSIYYNIGVVSEKMFDFNKALLFYNKAIKVNNSFAEAHWNKSLILLRLKKYDEAWSEFEWRKRKRDFPLNRINLSECSKGDKNIRKILFYEEQGFGDTIQFMRFVSLLNAEVKGLVVRPELKRLAESSGLFDTIFLRDKPIEEIDDFDCKLSLLSLPFFLNIKNVFLKKSIWNYRRRKSEHNNIGIFWRGNSLHENDEFRSVKLQTILKPLININCNLFSFEPNPTEEEREILRKFNVYDLSERISDFLDTAELLSDIDLLVSVDTAIVHLAGSMKLKTFLLLPKNFDWRWQNGEFTDWYESIELFPQKELGKWNDVLEKVADKVLDFCDSNNFRTTKISGEATVVLNDAIKFFNEGKNKEGLDVLLNAFRKGIKSNEIIFNIANAYHKLGNFNEAKIYYEMLFPKIISEEVYYNYLLLLLTLNKVNEIGKIINIVEKEFHDSEKINFLIGKFFFKTENFDKAEIYYRKSIELNPNFPDALKSLASLFFVTGKIKEAEKIYNKMINLYPRSSENHYNIGLVYQELKKYDDAEIEIKKALSLEKKPEYEFALSEILLTKGNYDEGLNLYETRFKIKPLFIKPVFTRDLYKVVNKRILIFEEQGIGDTIQFIRFAIPLKDSNKIIFAGRESLLPLIEKQKFIDKVVSLDEIGNVRYDYAIPIVSLFYLYYSSFNKILSYDKYLTVDYKFKLNPERINVALAWRGNPFPLHQRKRHINLNLFAKFFEELNINFYLLQKDLNNEEKNLLYGFPNLIWENEFFSDFNSVASLVKSVDLVISVDTVFLHLAGALGKKSIGLLHYSPDWRWGAFGNETVFYPKVNLIRQKSYGDWGNVLDELLVILTRLKR